MIETILHLLNTPYLYLTLGVISALAMFISPIIANGDYRFATKMTIVLTIFVFFVTILQYSHFHLYENWRAYEWSQPVILTTMVALAYSFGLFLGIALYRRVHNVIIN
jgi:preprotein translocase subunit SecG